MRYYHWLCWLILLVSPLLAEPAPGCYHSLRLSPGQDLKVELTRYLKEHKIGALAVVTCVGSLTEAHLRFANKKEGSRLTGPFEIVSLEGCGGPDGWHLHLSVSDGEGRTLGGHLLKGSLVYTTAELVLVELEGTIFRRVHDPATGYPELRIEKMPSGSER